MMVPVMVSPWKLIVGSEILEFEFLWQLNDVAKNLDELGVDYKIIEKMSKLEYIEDLPTNR